MLNLQIHVDAAAAGQAVAMLRGMDGPQRRVIHSFMASTVENLTRDHLLSIGSTRHGTAMRLGAAPSGFLTNAAGTVQAEATEEGVRLTMQRAGLSRAFRPYDLRPVRARLLTIPIKAESYGKRAREFAGLKWRRFSREAVAARRSDTAGLVLGRDTGGMFIALFRAARRVQLPQNRTLLPGDQEWAGAMELGLRDWLEARALA